MGKAVGGSQEKKRVRGSTYAFRTNQINISPGLTNDTLRCIREKNQTVLQAFDSMYGRASPSQS